MEVAKKFATPACQERRCSNARFADAPNTIMNSAAPIKNLSKPLIEDAEVASAAAIVGSTSQTSANSKLIQTNAPSARRQG